MMVTTLTVAVVCACLAGVHADWAKWRKENPLPDWAKWHKENPSTDWAKWRKENPSTDWAKWRKENPPPDWAKWRKENPPPDWAKWRKANFPDTHTPRTRYREGNAEQPKGHRSGHSVTGALVGSVIALLIAIVCCLPFCVCLCNRRGAKSSSQNGQRMSTLTNVNVITNSVQPAPPLATREAAYEPGTERNVSAESTDPPPYNEVVLQPSKLPPPYPG